LSKLIDTLLQFHAHSASYHTSYSAFLALGSIQCLHLACGASLQVTLISEKLAAHSDWLINNVLTPICRQL